MSKKAAKQPDPKEETPSEGLASLLRIAAVALFVLTFAFENFVIPSSSMASTLLIGDHVIADRVEFAPAASWAPFLHYRDVRRGDIIFFYKPRAEPNGKHIYLVKRVIGIPGDHIHLRDGIVYLNGAAQSEPYATEPSYGDYDPYRNDFPDVPPSAGADVIPAWAADLPNHVQGRDLVVPPGSYFAMGDNRPVSLDSRYWDSCRARISSAGRSLSTGHSLLPRTRCTRPGFPTEQASRSARRSTSSIRPAGAEPST